VEGVSRLLLTFALVAVLVRGIIPTGWMPSTDRAFAITVCTGTASETVWLDMKGALHKQDPAKKERDTKSEPCTFAGMAVASGLPIMPTVIGPLVGKDSLVAHLPSPAAIGQGLAAPPPPARGPPHLI
jgi:hypothetical protein